MEHIGAHIDRNRRKERVTERGELMRYFCDKLNMARTRDGYEHITMPHMGKILEAIPTKDLYYLKSVCDQAAARGGEFSKKFWWEIDPKKHEKEWQEKREKAKKRKK